MTLYEIEVKMLDCIDPETGEIDEERLNALEMEKEAKLENVALWIKDLKAEAEAIKNEEAALKRRRESSINKMESLKRYLTWALDGSKFKTPKVAVSYRRSESVKINDDAEVPEQYRRIKWEPDKTALKDALKAGETFDGITLEEKQSIQIK